MSKLLIPGILQQQVNQQDSGGGGDWDYEGVMTVGDIYGFVFGWDANYPTGSINPTPVQVSGYNECGIISWDGNLYVQEKNSPYNKCANVIEIDGVEFTGFNSDGTIFGISNPFPAVGETCTIKLK